MVAGLHRVELGMQTIKGQLIVIGLTLWPELVYAYSWPHAPVWLCLPEPLFHSCMGCFYP